MNSSNKINQRCQQMTNWEDYMIEKEVDSYNSKKKRIEKIKIQIKFTQDQKIIYSQNAVILKYKAMMSLENQECIIIWIKFSILSGKVCQVKKKRKMVIGLHIGIKSF